MIKSHKTFIENLKSYHFEVVSSTKNPEMSDKTLKSEYLELTSVNEKTLPEYILAMAKLHAVQGKDYWLVDGLTDEKRYYNKFDEETRKIASGFYKLGLRKGDIVLYMIRDLCKLYIMFTGVWRANGTMGASYPDDDADTTLHRLKEYGSNIIVCDEDEVELCKAVVGKMAQSNIKIVTVNRSNSNTYSIQQFLEDDDGSDCPEITVTEDDPAIILCTSGTTGLPKGAVHTHRSFLNQIRTMARGPYTTDKPNLLASKATHATGTTLGLIILVGGKTSVVVSNLTLDNIISSVVKYKPGFIFAFPTFLLGLVNAQEQGHDVSSIEAMFTAGTIVTPAVKKQLYKLPNLKDVVIWYGLTEIFTCASTIMEKDGGQGFCEIRDIPNFSVGKPYPGTELQIRDPDTLEILGVCQQGEICAKAPSLFQYYLNNPEATEKAFVDGYFRTGDIGYYDENGFVYVVDRLKEIFKHQSNHVSPSELENLIGTHPKVKEVCVVGIPDGVFGHIPRAFVTVHSYSESKENLGAEIKEYANSKLASYKHLSGGVYIVDELPRGKTGKVSRQLVEKLPVP